MSVVVAAKKLPPSAKRRGNPKFGKSIGFKKGDARAGRPPGVQNKFSRDLKEAIIRGAELSEHSETNDLVGYTTFLANKRPDIFAGLLGRLIPVQAKVQHTNVGDTNITVNMPLGEMISNFERRIKSAAVPELPAPKPEPPVIENDLDIVNVDPEDA